MQSATLSLVLPEDIRSQLVVYAVQFLDERVLIAYDIKHLPEHGGKAWQDMAQDGAEAIGVDYTAISFLRDVEGEICGDEIACLKPGIIDAYGFETGNAPLIFSGFSFCHLARCFSCLEFQPHRDESGIPMKRRRKVTLPDGNTGYENIDLRKRLSLTSLRYTNLTHAAGKHDLPALAYNTEVLPDDIALSGYPSQYYKTPLTAVGFWEYDKKFDGYEGLFNAIYYDQEDLLERYRSRYAGVRFLFAPEYSQFGDVSDLEEHYRLLKARIVGIWFAMELGAVVIPFITVPTPESVGFALDRLENCSVAAFSTKGYVDDPVERNVSKELVRLTVDTLDLKAIVVYDACPTNDAVDGIFSYAKEKGIEIVVPSNALKERNAIKREKRHAKQ